MATLLLIMASKIKLAFNLYCQLNVERTIAAFPLKTRPYRACAIINILEKYATENCANIFFSFNRRRMRFITLNAELKCEIN